MICNIEEYSARFVAFAEGFLEGNARDDANVRLKIDHSLRVLEEAGLIVRSLGLDTTPAALTHLAALFHDIGRFPQYRRFRTFNDAISVNHARLSVDTLRDTGILSQLLPDHRRLILGAIFLHNRRLLPPSLEPRLALLTKIVRDADKLDIVRVLLTHFSEEDPDNAVITLGLRPHRTEYSRNILLNLQSRQPVRYQDMVWVNDFKLLVCSWLYDLNFPVSRATLLERRYVDHIFQCLPQTQELLDLNQRLTNELAAMSQPLHQ